jgi:hypothetical protein
MLETEQQAIDRISAMSPAKFKIFENRLRRMAARQGLKLIKHRARDPRALNYGCYALSAEGIIVAGDRMQIDDVERYLLGAARRR